MLELQIITNDSLDNIHPGQVLKEDFLEPLEISVKTLSESIHISEENLSAIIAGESAVTADIAIRFSHFFGTSSQFWLNLQNMYDLEEENKKHAKDFRQIVPFSKTHRPQQRTQSVFCKKA